MTSFHVRHDFSPVVAREALLLLRTLPTTNAENILAQAQNRDYELGRRRSLDKIVASLRDLGLLERERVDGHGGLRLTPLGFYLADVAVEDPLLFAEYIHLRYSCLWDADLGQPPFSWAYRTVADILWEEAPCRIDSDRLVGMVAATALDRFGSPEISFSTSSVLGILHWLRALRPHCVIGETFRRRPACPPEAVLSALLAIASRRGLRAGTPVRIDGGVRSATCRMVLADEAALDYSLEQAEESLGLVRRSGDGGDMVVIPPSASPKLTEESHIP